MARYLIRLITSLLLLIVFNVQADTLRDPTMPPAIFDGETVAVVPTVTGPVLQSISLSSPNKFAIIDGQAVKLGHQYQQYTLTKLTANDAVLKDIDGSLLHLKMDFQIEKKLSGNDEMFNQNNK